MQGITRTRLALRTNAYKTRSLYTLHLISTVLCRIKYKRCIKIIIVLIKAATMHFGFWTSEARGVRTIYGNTASSRNVLPACSLIIVRNHRISWSFCERYLEIVSITVKSSELKGVSDRPCETTTSPCELARNRVSHGQTVWVERSELEPRKHESTSVKSKKVSQQVVRMLPQLEKVRKMGSKKSNLLDGRYQGCFEHKSKKSSKQTARMVAL